MADLSAVLRLVDSGDEDLLTADESALLIHPQPVPDDFGANLADSLPESVLTAIGRLVDDGYRADEASRKEWAEREKRAIRLLGISENDLFEPAFEGGSTAIFPGITEAMIQFQARAMAEVWPPEGPAKAFVEGQRLDPQREQQAQQVAGYLNWLYTDRMPGGYQQHDKMLFRLGLSGSCFKKVAFDALAGCVVSRFVPAEELVIPYGASDLETTPRITHILKYSGVDVERMMAKGAYRPVDLVDSSLEQPTPLQPELDAIDGKTEPSAVSSTDLRRSVVKRNRFDRALPMTCLEQSVFLDLDGEPENAPYLVTIERDSQKVLAVYRDWRKTDAETPKRRKRFVHYYFFPGLDGFYGIGFLHLLGRFAETQSGNLRALLDAAYLANLKGGFRSADVRLPKGNNKDGIRVKPGEWLQVNATADELQKLFVTIPYGEPSQTLFNLLSWMDDVMRRISGTTAELVGESAKNVPVGTTLARIEQGLKVQTEIQIRIHQAQAAELSLAVQVTADTFPDANYCRDVLGVEPAVFAAAFDARVDVRPVSNPNAITSTQRMVIAQALVEIADKAPDLIDRREAYKRLMEAMRVQDIDKLLLDQSQPPPRMGPVEENMALVMSKPVRSYPDQDHGAHLVVHQQWFETLDDNAKQRVETTTIAHVAEHLAWQYYLQMQQAMGVNLPASPMGQQQPLDPQVENQLAVMAAQAVQLMAQQHSPPPIDPSAAQAASRAQVDQAKTEAEIRRKDTIAAAQINRDDHAMMAKMNRDAAEQEARLIGKYMSTAGKQALGQPNLSTQMPL